MNSISKVFDNENYMVSVNVGECEIYIDVEVFSGKVSIDRELYFENDQIEAIDISKYDLPIIFSTAGIDLTDTEELVEDINSLRERVRTINDLVKNYLTSPEVQEFIKLFDASNGS